MNPASSRNSLSLLLLVLTMACAAASHSSPPSAQAIIGSWELVSFESQPGAPESPIGPTPVGFIVYDKAGNVAAQLMRSDRGATPSLTPANPGGTAAVAGYIAYFGSYSVDRQNSVVTHRIKAAVAESDVGRVLTRRFRFEGEMLVLEVGSGAELRTLKWRRVST
jgi:hypothetical protein